MGRSETEKLSQDTVPLLTLYLDVEMLKSAAGVRHQLDPLIRHHLAAAHAQLPDGGGVSGEGPQAQVRHVALPDV